MAYPHEVLSGIDGQLPPITGYVLTTVKPNPLVEIGLATNRHSEPNNTILATWQYGLGRTAVLTTDVGQRWATAWTDWPNYEKLLTQLVRWSMRPSDNQGQFHLAADLRDHLIRVTVTGLDEDKSYLNSVQMAGAIVGPTGEPSRFALTQTAPGRYLGEFPAETPGNYYVAVQPGARGTPLRTAINVPQSAEFDRTTSNDLLLEQLASGVPTGGQPGRLLEPEAAIQPGEVGEPEPSLLSADVFRHDLAPAKHYQAIWPFVLLVAGCLFFSDVFCRRVQISFDWWPKWSNGWRSRAMAEPSETAIRLDRLKRQKQAAISLTASEMAKASDKHFVAESSGEEASQAKQAIELPATSPVLGFDESAESSLSYTERLLRAKRRPNN
ncbi:MAG: glutamine amidotransferase [Pirellulaceae bacterium]